MPEGTRGQVSTFLSSSHDSYVTTCTEKSERASLTTHWFPPKFQKCVFFSKKKVIFSHYSFYLYSQYSFHLPIQNTAVPQSSVNPPSHRGLLAPNVITLQLAVSQTTSFARLNSVSCGYHMNPFCGILAQSSAMRYRSRSSPSTSSDHEAFDSHISIP